MLPIRSIFFPLRVAALLRLGFLDVCRMYMYYLLFVLFDLILYVPSTIFQLNRDGSSWVELVLS